MTGDEVQALLELAQSAVAEAHAETELVRAELNDVREDMAQVELERDEYRRAYVKWRSELFAAVGRTGTKFDRELMRAFDR